MVKKIEDTTDDNRKVYIVESKEFKEKQENLNGQCYLKTIKFEFFLLNSFRIEKTKLKLIYLFITFKVLVSFLIN